jgi:RNA polymerase sigma-70 factor (ECF subfamily)
MAEIALDYERASDVELCRLVVQRDPHAIRLITSRNNQRLYRAAWSILKDRAEAEEAVQDGYLKAFAAMNSFGAAPRLKQVGDEHSERVQDRKHRSQGCDDSALQRESSRMEFSERTR